MKDYYYLHSKVNKLIFVPSVVVDDSEYFSCPFVKKYWKYDSEDKNNNWLIMLEASALGLDETQMKQLAEEWNLTKNNLPDFMAKNDPDENKLLIDGSIRFVKVVFDMDVDGLISLAFQKIMKLIKEGT